VLLGKDGEAMPQNHESSLADLITPFTEGIARHRALPPDQKNRARAHGGAGVIAFCLYALITEHRMVFGDWIAFAIWAGLFGFGALWFYIGYRASIGQRDIMAAFWSFGGILFFLALMAFGVYLPDDWLLINFLLKGLYIGSAAGSAMKFWLSVRGMSSTTLEEVRAQQAHGRARDATEAEAAARLDEQAAPRPRREFQD
jgi:hypothetical protein